MTLITVTPQAQEHIIAMLDKESKQVVQLSLEPQGCNGYKYTWTPTDNHTGHEITLRDNYKIIVEDSAVPFVKGSEVILGVTGFNKKLTILNPNEMGSCGCGESVNFK